VNAGSETPGDEEAEWEEACRREVEIRRLVAEERSGVIGRAAVGEAAAKLGISIASLYRLIRRFREDRRVSVLLPRRAGRPAGTRYISGGR
jgi:transposase